MNNDEAKFILAGYRPDGRDAAAPAFAEALEQAKRDPAVGAWFDRSRAFDHAVAEKLKGFAPPAELREAILAGGRFGGSARAERGRWPMWLGLAAAVVILIGGGLIWRRSQGPDPAQFARYAIADLYVPGHKDDPDPTMEAWLAAHHAPLERAALPVDLERMRQAGCRELRFRGRGVVELCFKRDGSWFHLYVLGGGQGGPAPMTLAQANGAAAVWSDGRFTYALATRAPLSELQRML